MNKSKNLVICTLAAFIVLAGCGKDAVDTASPAAVTTDAPVVAATDAPVAATVAPAATDAPVVTEAPAGPVSIIAYAAEPDKTAENANLAARIKRFTAKNPTVTITPKFWKYQNTEVAIKMASNSAQTEFTTWATEAKLLSGKKWIADLTDSLAGWEFGKDLNEVALAPFIVEGKTYGVPLDAYSMTITLNKKLFAAKGVALPPLDWTWDDLLTAAKALNDPAKGIAGFIPMGKGTEAGWNWTNYLYSAGGDVETVADGKVTAAFNSPEGLKALQFYKDLKDANVIPKNWALGYGDALSLFNQGRGAMVMCGSGNAAEAAINQGGMSKDDVVIYPIPSIEKGGKHIGVAGGNYKVINGLATPEQQKAAFDFTVDEMFTDDYLNAIDTQITEQVAKKQVFVPQLINYWNASSEYNKKFQAMLAKHDNVFIIPEELQGLITPHVEAAYGAQEFYLEMSNVIQKVFTTKGDLDLQKLLDDAAAKLQKATFDKVVIG